jgi:hypothetical protein
MKKILFLLLSLIFILNACQTKSKNQGNLIVKGEIKGLRLGTLLLKQMKNDSLTVIDSIKIDGNEIFKFTTRIDQPQMMMLELPEVKDGRLLFFAAPNDTIDIFTYVESFGLYPKIKGGVNQNKRNEYEEMILKFNNKELDLTKEKFEAAKAGYTVLADSLAKRLENLQKKRKLYALNFIFGNKDKAIAPYVGIMEFYNNPKALDTIYKVLTEEAKNTIFGLEIKKALKQ